MYNSLFFLPSPVEKFSVCTGLRILFRASIWYFWNFLSLPVRNNSLKYITDLKFLFISVFVLPNRAHQAKNLRVLISATYIFSLSPHVFICLTIVFYHCSNQYFLFISNMYSEHYFTRVCLNSSIYPYKYLPFIFQTSLAS